MDSIAPRRVVCLVALTSALLLTGCGNDGDKDGSGADAGRNGSGVAMFDRPPPEPDDWSLIDPLIAERIGNALDDVNASPRHAGAWLYLAKVYDANLRHVEAEMCYEAVIELDSSVAEAQYLLAHLHHRSGRESEAMAAITRAAELDPDDTPSRWQAGFWQLDAGDIEAARKSFEAAIAIDPDNDAAWFGIARIHLQLRETDDAIELIEGRLLSTRSQLYARQLLAAAYRQAGRLEDARFEKARSRDARPNFNDPRRRAMMTLRTGLLAELTAGTGLSQANRPREAIARLEKLRDRWPDDVRVLNALATALADGGREDEALALMEAVHVDHRDHYLTNLNLAYIHQKLAQGDASKLAIAETFARRTIEINPTHSDPHARLAVILVEMRRLHDAAESFRAAYELNPGDASVLMRVGIIEAQQRRTEAAAYTFAQVVMQDPSLAEAYLLLARAKMMLGANADARAAVETAARLLPPNHPGLRQAQEMVRDPR